VARPDPLSSLLPELPRNARIVVARLRSIGDIVLLTPALRALKEWRPDLRVSILVEARFRELLEMIPEADEALLLGAGNPPSNAGSRLRTLISMRRQNFQLCLNLHGGPTSAILTALSGARWKVGFAHFRTRWIYNAVVPDARNILHQEQIHTAEHQASAFLGMGLPLRELPRSRLAVLRRDYEWWETQRVLLGLPVDRPYAVLHPTALYATKQWRPENFARLGQYLEEHDGMTPLFSAGPGETAILDGVERVGRGQIRRLENVTLGQLAAALAGARLFVGNDSGPAHMAQALGTPAVVIFGSSSSVIWGPWPKADLGRRTIVVQNPFACNPCPGDRCYRFDRPECILSVTLEQVENAVEQLLGAGGDASVAARPPAPKSPAGME
jgi:ADP-heptose:LPS heptosyltransferase